MSAARDLLEVAREVWPENTTARDMVINLAVVHGDLARAIRTPERSDDRDLPRELGNLVLMALRYLDDHGIDVDEALRVAVQAQRDWRRNHGMEDR